MSLDSRKRIRRAHSKSRFGCANCKRLRVKCDEDRPACQNCIKRNKPCEYPMVSIRTRRRNSTNPAPNQPNHDLSSNFNSIHEYTTEPTVDTAAANARPSTTGSNAKGPNSNSPNTITSTTGASGVRDGPVRTAAPTPRSLFAASGLLTDPAARPAPRSAPPPLLRAVQMTGPSLSDPGVPTSDADYSSHHGSHAPPAATDGLMSSPPQSRSPIALSNRFTFHSGSDVFVDYASQPAIVTSLPSPAEEYFSPQLAHNRNMAQVQDRPYAAAQSRGPHSPSRPLGDFDPFEQKLMDHYKSQSHHFMVCDGMSLLSDETVWKEYVPPLVLQYPCLCHSFYAITALHLGRASGDLSTEKYALGRFFRSLEEFERLIAEPSPRSQGQEEAVFLCTVFLMMLAFAFESEIPMIAKKPGEVDVLSLVRGPLIVARNQYPVIQEHTDGPDNGPGSVPMSIPAMSSQFFGLDHFPRTHSASPNYSVYDMLIDTCKSLHATMFLSSQVMAVCITAIEELRNNVEQCSRYESPIGLLGWQMCLSAEFLHLLRVERNEFARVIFCYHLAGLSHIRGLFWVSKRPAREVFAIYHELHNTWMHLLKWPLDTIKNQQLDISQLWNHAHCERMNPNWLDQTL